MTSDFDTRRVVANAPQSDAEHERAPGKRTRTDGLEATGPASMQAAVQLAPAAVGVGADAGTAGALPFAPGSAERFVQLIAGQATAATPALDGEAKKDGVPEGEQAKPTPAGSPAETAPDPSLGKTVSLGGGVWTVTRSDSLWSIATSIYGKGTYWVEIKNANKAKVHGPNHIIRDGDVMTLPKLAVPTLTALVNFQSRPAELRDLVGAMTAEEWEGFWANTSAADKQKHAVLLQKVEMMRSTGMTMQEMATEQKEFLEKEAAKKGVSAGEYVKDIIATKGYGGGTAKDWEKNTAAQKQAWHDRFKKLVAGIKTSAPPDVKAIIKDAESKGGGFRWNPAETEANGAFAYTQGDWALHCGTRFVEVGESDPSVCYANIAHEMGGHNYYGDDELGAEIQNGAIGQLSPEERAKALSGGNSMFSAYGYMETEIFAELYEFRYDSDQNPTDHPFDADPKGNDMTKTAKRAGDVKNQLTRIKESFAPKVAEGLVRGLARRVASDPRILELAKERFRADVKTVFGIAV